MLLESFRPFRWVYYNSPPMRACDLKAIIAIEAMVFGRENVWRSNKVGPLLVSYKWSYNPYLGGGFKYFLFSPLFGEDSHFD